MRYLPDNNLSYPVLLEIGESSGSGFYLVNDRTLFLVTAKHVIYETNKGEESLCGDTLVLTSYVEDLNITDPVVISVDLFKVSIRKNDVDDLVLIELGDIRNTESKYFDITFKNCHITQGPQGGKIVTVPTSNLRKFEDVLTSNEVFILGYPSSIGGNGNQIETKRPLLRKGIIAGKNLINKTIILDCPVYFGNSGGVAIEIENQSSGGTSYKIIGVVAQYIPFVEKLYSQLGYTNSNVENSGYSVVIPIDTILDLAS